MPTSRKKLRLRESRRGRGPEQSRCRKDWDRGSPARGGGCQGMKETGEEENATGPCHSRNWSKECWAGLDKDDCGPGDARASDSSSTCISSQSHRPLTPLRIHIHKGIQTGDNGNM